METADQVKIVIAKALRVPATQLTDDTKLQDLGAESIDMIEIMFELEEKFDVELAVDLGDSSAGGNAAKKPSQLQLQDLVTVGDVCRAITTIVVAKAPK
jgi:acyl carrier protein